MLSKATAWRGVTFTRKKLLIHWDNRMHILCFASQLDGENLSTLSKSKVNSTSFFVWTEGVAAIVVVFIMQYLFVGSFRLMLQNYTMVVTLCVKVACIRLNLSLYSAFWCEGILSSTKVFQKRPLICYPSVFFESPPSSTFCHRPMVLNFPIFVISVLSDGLFFLNRRVVFYKTTYHFRINNVSFSIKQRVVFYKTTCRFFINIVLLFHKHSITEKILSMNRNLSTESLKCEKTYIPLARAHVYTRITGVFVFLLSQVSHKNL